MKRIVLILTVSAMMAAMTLGFAGSAMAQEEAAGAQSADELLNQMFAADPNGSPDCLLAFGAITICAPGLDTSFLQ